MNLPNRLTLFRVVLIPFFLVFLLNDAIPLHYLWAFLVYGAACVTDTLDGRIARKRGLETDFGRLMDPLADKLLVMSAIVAFIPAAGVPAWAVILILAREFMVTSLRLIAAGKGVVIPADRLGKVKTVSQMIWVSYTLLYLWLWQGTAAGRALFAAGLAVSVITTVVSGAHYMIRNRALFSGR